ncbi:hypothetical protein PIROE2DRAFT_2135 [Piromyces sp. E2]|nr:hypothetical protein PIROE2DRAFT_2135 [Piromyces sp. E2]|eukprot:OUM69935.1 hypothetical protein PIROE2DRAFT_2135 [Piromyces sp. E2]
MLSKIIILLLLSYLYTRINGIELNILGFTRDANDNQVYTPSVDEFNKYSIKNGLNIKLNLMLLTQANITFSVTDYGTIVEALLNKNSKKYDIYFYDNVYIDKYGEYLQDLKGLISDDLINKYDPQIFKESCIYKDHIVGIPVRMGFSVLYSNEKILKKYEKSIPKTWDELLETGKYVLKKERELNNTNLIGFSTVLDKVM